ncbi:hypothetical protein Tco_0608550 [Tanacetum coccineum]
MDGWFSFICDVAKFMVELYNRPVVRSWGQANQSCPEGNKSVDMSGKLWYKYAGAESVRVSDCKQGIYKEAGNLKAVIVMSISVELLKHILLRGFDDVGLRFVGGRWVLVELTYGFKWKALEKDFKAVI